MIFSILSKFSQLKSAFVRTNKKVYYKIIIYFYKSRARYGKSILKTDIKKKKGKHEKLYISCIKQ